MDGESAKVNDWNGQRIYGIQQQAVNKSMRLEHKRRSRQIWKEREEEVEGENRIYEHVRDGEDGKGEGISHEHVE
jgi:hypothetical protein